MGCEGLVCSGKQRHPPSPVSVDESSMDATDSEMSSLCSNLLPGQLVFNSQGRMFSPITSEHVLKYSSDLNEACMLNKFATEFFSGNSVNPCKMGTSSTPASCHLCRRATPSTLVYIRCSYCEKFTCPACAARCGQCDAHVCNVCSRTEWVFYQWTLYSAVSCSNIFKFYFAVLVVLTNNPSASTVCSAAVVMWTQG